MPRQSRITEFIEVSKKARDVKADQKSVKHETRDECISRIKQAVALNADSNYVLEVAMAIIDYPFMSSGTPWHSIGRLRLRMDLAKILATRGIKLSDHAFNQALVLLEGIGFLKWVREYDVVNIQQCVWI